MSRSLLVVAADDRAVLAKALDQGADAIVVDLVTAAPDPGPPRAAAAAFLAEAGPGARIFVRINSGPVGHDDARGVLAAVGSGGSGGVLAGLWAARTESAIQLDALDAVLSTMESERGMPGRSVAVVASLETSGSLLAAAAIARAPRVAWLHLAETELSLEQGLDPSPDGRELAAPRSQVVTAGAAAGLLAPVASAASTTDTTDELRTSTLALRRAGFRGRLCADPAQLAVVNQVLHPSAVEVAEAHELLERHAAALRDGVGVVLDGHGRVVDETRIRRARRILAYG